MKKKMKFLAICCLVFSIAFSTVALANSGIKVAIDGTYVEFDVQPQLINDRTMVPLRAIFEELGAEVDWDDATQTVIAMKNDVTVIATIGSTKMYIDDEEKIMDVAPMLIGGRTLVPVRFVAEAFGCDVDWDEEENTVIILSNGKLTKNDVITLVEKYVGDGLIASIKQTFTYNSTKYYEVSVKSKNSTSQMTSYIVSDNGIEFFEGKYDTKTKTIINYENPEIFESMTQE